MSTDSENLNGNGRTAETGKTPVISIADRVHVKQTGAGAIATAMLSANSRRAEAVTWRDEIEAQIWTHVWRLGLNTEQFFALISKKLRKYVGSLRDLDERDLGSAFEIIECALSRRTGEKR
jgi:hypothetical protein